MNIFLLRHGLAVDPGTPGYERDSDRPLTPKGIGKMRKIARAMGVLELEFDLLVSSPYVRARQTAEQVAEGLRLKKNLEFSELLTPGGSARELVDFLNHRHPRPENVLLVGHEPHLSEFISLLVSGSAHGAAVTMKKGGLCKLSAGTLHNGRCASLEWVLTPGQMACIKA